MCYDDPKHKHNHTAEEGMVRRHPLHIDLEPTMRQRLGWYIRTRWFFLLTISIPAIGSNLLTEGFRPEVQRDSMLAALALATNLLFFLFSRRLKKENVAKRAAITLIIIDILTITLLIYTKGGIESRSPILYTIPLLMTSAMFGQRGVYYTALMSISLYDILIILLWSGVITAVGVVTPSLQHNNVYILNTVAFFTSTLIIIAVLADFITHLLKRQQHAARESARALQQAQSLAKLGSWSWRVADNKLEWSEQMYEIFGFSKRQHSAIVPSFLKYVHKNDREALQSLIRTASRNGEPFALDHRVIVGKETRWFHLQGLARKDSAGNVIELYGTTQDITDRKKAEEALQQRSRELERLNEAMVGRELIMIELKQIIKSLEKRK